MEPTPNAQWPLQVQRLAEARPAPSSEARAELWLLVQGALTAYLRWNAHRMGVDLSAALPDLCHQKALELVQKLDSYKWKPEQDSPEQVRSFVAVVARNAIVDHLRREGRMQHQEEFDLDLAPSDPMTQERTDLSVQRREFAEALKACADLLPIRWREAWCLRVFYEWSSKQIAAHPQVGMSAPHVDVSLQRARGQLQSCLSQKGMGYQDLPPGAFAVLWEHFNLPAQAVAEEQSHG